MKKPAVHRMQGYLRKTIFYWFLEATLMLSMVGMRIPVDMSCFEAPLMIDPV